MLEILFTESAAGGLKYAKNYGKGPYKPKTVRFLHAADGTPLSRQEMDAYRKAAEEKERINWEKAVPMDIGTVIPNLPPLSFRTQCGILHKKRQRRTLSLFIFGW